MTSTLTLQDTKERRQFERSSSPPRFAINLVGQSKKLLATGVNFSEGGICVRLGELLEVRSLVQMLLTPLPSNEATSAAASHKHEQRPFRCTGRVAWIIQRMDIREDPPLFDVGIEFVNPPATLRRLVSLRGAQPILSRTGRRQHLEPTAIRGRNYVPSLERARNNAAQWHLVVSVDGAPCFSSHYPSAQAAVTAWTRFKREQSKR